MEEENTSSCDDHLNLHQNIPQDVFIQILVFLPVISLLRFKSVCKSWRVLIQTSFFIDLHLKTTTTNNKFGTFIFQTSQNHTKTRKSEAFMLSSSSSSSSAAGGGGEDDANDNNEFEKLIKWEDLEFPPRYKVTPVKTYMDEILMVGSCNGLICIHDSNRREVSLWNPATRQFRILPAESLGIPEGYIDEFIRSSDYVGFGYDVKTNDYKVLLISNFKPYNMSDQDTTLDDFIFQVQVYSLSTDSWRLLEGINSLPAVPWQTDRGNHGVYLKKNGSYYFMGIYLIASKLTLMLLSFDFTKEIFTTIQLPHEYDHHRDAILTSFGEKQLGVFARSPPKEDESDFVPYDIWVLNEHHGGGDKEEGEEPSWTKLHSIRLNFDYTENCTKGIPRSISNNGEFALIYTEGYRVINGEHASNRHWLQLFNLVTHEVKKEFPTGRVIRAEVYKQSLVSTGGNGTTADMVIGAEM